MTVSVNRCPRNKLRHEFVRFVKGMFVGLLATLLICCTFLLSEQFSSAGQATAQPTQSATEDNIIGPTVVSPDGELIVSIVPKSQPGYGTIFIRDAATTQELFSFEFHAVDEQQVVFSPDSMNLYFREVGDLLHWNRTTNTHNLIDGTFWVNKVIVSPDHHYAAVVGTDELHSSPDNPNVHLTLIDLQLAAITYSPIPEGVVEYENVKFSDDSTTLFLTACIGYTGDMTCNPLSLDVKSQERIDAWLSTAQQVITIAVKALPRDWNLLRSLSLSP